MGLGLLTSNSNNNIHRALSLIKSLGNAVFISENQEQRDKLAVETLTRLSNAGFNQRAVRLDIRTLIDTFSGVQTPAKGRGRHTPLPSIRSGLSKDTETKSKCSVSPWDKPRSLERGETWVDVNKDQAGLNFQGIIHHLREAKGKIVLLATALEEVMRDARIISMLREVVEQKSVPILGTTNIEGFRRLEERPDLSGFLQFILAEKEESQTKRNKSVLIIGATSLLGNALYNLFSQEYEDVKGTGFSKANLLGFDKLDVTSEEEIEKYFFEHPNFNVIIYAAGQPDADVAEKEKDRARDLNTDALKSIARHTKNCKFVYISSEYVFDGNSGPYGSGSLANPVNYYGRTKLEGEKVSLGSFSNALVLRLGALYGYNGPNDKKTSVSKLIASLDNPEPLEVDNVQIKHPILLEDAARTLLKLLDYQACGIYQANGPEGLNKQEMAERIAAAWNELTGRKFCYPIIGIEQTGTAAKPLNTHMVNVDTPMPFNEGIRFMLGKQETFKKKNNYEYR